MQTILCGLFEQKKKKRRTRQDKTRLDLIVPSFNVRMYRRSKEIFNILL